MECLSQWNICRKFHMWPTMIVCSRKYSHFTIIKHLSWNGWCWNWIKTFRTQYYRQSVYITDQLGILLWYIGVATTLKRSILIFNEFCLLQWNVPLLLKKEKSNIYIYHLLRLPYTLCGKNEMNNEFNALSLRGIWKAAKIEQAFLECFRYCYILSTRVSVSIYLDKCIANIELKWTVYMTISFQTELYIAQSRYIENMSISWLNCYRSDSKL